MIDQKQINKELDDYFTATDSQCWESAALRVLIRLKIASLKELEDRIGGLAAEWLDDHDYDTVETQQEGYNYLYNYFTQPYDNFEDLLSDLYFGKDEFFPYLDELEKKFKSILPHVIK